MHTIRENDFSRIDLNLLLVLLVLHREGSVSRAAKKLHLGQPAVSGALARLRATFNDPLFVRTPKGMVPTPRAETLVTELQPIMAQMQQLLFQAPSFSPRHDSHTFRLGMSDWVERWLMPPLLGDVATQAAGIHLHISASDPFQDEELVLNDKIDVAVSVGEHVPAGLLREKITTMGFCTMWHPLQLALTSPLTLDDYVSYDHLLVSYRGAAAGVIDEKLAETGRQRRVRYVTPYFSSLPLMLGKLPALTTVPAGLATGWVEQYGLCCSEVPLRVPSFTLSLLWSQRRNNDPALQWLLALLRAGIRQNGMLQD